MSDNPDEPQDLDTVLTVPQAAEGSRKDLLIALRTRIAGAVDNPKTPSRDLAPLARLLTEIARDIERIDAGGSDLAAASATPDEDWDGS